MAVCVADLLQLEAMKGAQFLAGAKGVKREVKHIDVLEVPDFKRLATPHVLFLTTGYALRDNPELQQEMIRRMVEVKTAGLAIQAGQYLTPLPVAMLELADALEFPIIELPAQVVFTDIISNGLRQIFSHREAILVRSQEVHRRLAEVVLAGGNLTQIAQTLADFVHNTVIISDQNFRLLAFAHGSAGVQRVHRRQAYPIREKPWINSWIIWRKLVLSNRYARIKKPVG